MAQRNSRRYVFAHPLVGASSSVWRRLTRAHQVDPPFWPKALNVTVCTAAAAPLRALDRRFIRTNAPPAKPPVFIIGHWRSGTTHLHNLLCQDAQFGYVSTFQTIIPGGCISGRRILAPIIRARMPTERPMDNMELTLFGPQEEEIALAHMTPCAYYHALYFPRDMRSFFDRYVMFDRIRDDERSEWASCYRALLAKASHIAGGRRLVLKNPANTGRISALLELYPDAKFIHVYRDPYVVIPSTIHFYDRILPITVLQRFERTTLVDNVYAMYEALVARCLETQSAVPARQWAEVRFEDLERDPIGELDRLYRTLDLGPFDARDRVASYAEAKAGYRKNTFELEPTVSDRIAAVSKAAVERWGYTRPGWTA
ncbi:MAG: sulfotransferase [Candidatus Hydrogenedentes bacterium]|nr:sulfotransferase [Candidatus Hydrogenedentota bacterium]